MKKITLSMLVIIAASNVTLAQKVKDAAVPAVVRSALMKKYPQASKITWEKEKGNYEANWGGNSGEDMSVQYTTSGRFVEQVAAISVNQLPAGIKSYIQQHYAGVKITEAGRITDAKGTTMYEAEVKGKDLVFDKKGSFLKVD